jgi:hypothetical protein
LARLRGGGGRRLIIDDLWRQSKIVRRAAGTDPDTANPPSPGPFDQAAIDAEAATNGWYALLSNLPPDDADTTQVLIIYKGQEAVERRYSAFKGPSPSPPSTSRTTGVSPHWSP